MSHQNLERQIAERINGADGRRRELRTLLLTAAHAARQTRRIRQLPARVSASAGRAVRDRVSMLLSAAG